MKSKPTWSNALGYSATSAFLFLSVRLPRCCVMSTMRPLQGRSRSRAALVEQDNGRLDASKAGDARTPSARTLQGLDWFNFFLADVQTGIGPFLAIYLAGYGWNQERVGIALAVGGIAGILTQTPAGAVGDRLRSKRALIAAGIVALAVGALLIALAVFLLAVVVTRYISVGSIAGAVALPAI